jgi:hypothetical protein
MLNNTFNQDSISLGTIIILIAIILSSIGILFNLIIIIFLIHRDKFLKHSNKNNSHRIEILSNIRFLLILCIVLRY